MAKTLEKSSGAISTYLLNELAVRNLAYLINNGNSTTDADWNKAPSDCSQMMTLAQVSAE